LGSTPIGLLQYIRRALVTREKVRAFVGRPTKPCNAFTRASRRTRSSSPPSAENCIDQIMPDAGFALLDFQAVGEEISRLTSMLKQFGILQSRMRPLSSK
jgi:hypothetical protein